MLDFLRDNGADLAFRSYQHVSLVVQSVAIATVIAVALALLVVNHPKLRGVADAISAIGLTVPSLALLGVALPLFGVGALPSVAIVSFYAVLPILRNAVVGLQSVPAELTESARGMGLGSIGQFLRVRLPLAWPVILAGVRTSTQMSMGVAAIGAYALGPGLGSYIFTGLATIGGANAVNYALVGTIGIVILALLLDVLLLALGRLTISRGIRV
ncbi:ABC transporter permease [Dermacoccaceae bacterium W4C1]